MSTCPSCGGIPQATTQNASTGEAFYECGNSHFWKVEENPPAPSPPVKGEGVSVGEDDDAAPPRKGGGLNGPAAAHPGD